MQFDEAIFTDNQDLSRFELQVSESRAFIDYRMEGDVIYLNHTEVPEELEGHGVAKSLVEKAFAYIEQKDLKIVPLCSYIGIFLRRHPEWNRLLAKR